jgi:adenylate kinase family enzyme
VRVTAPDALAWCLETASPLAAALRAALDEFAAARAKKRPPAAKKKPGAEECVERPRVPTQLMAQAVRARLEAQDARERGFVLDGFPGDAAELAAIDTPLDAAVELAVERAAAEARLTDALEGYSDRPGFERRWAAHAERVRDALAALAAKQVPLLRVDSAHTPPDHAARQLVALARQKPRGQQAERAAQAEKEPEKAPQELLEEQKRGERAADSVREDEREVLEARLKAKREEILSSGELQSLFQAARGEAGAVAM